MCTCSWCCYVRRTASILMYSMCYSTPLQLVCIPVTMRLDSVSAVNLCVCSVLVFLPPFHFRVKSTTSFVWPIQFGECPYVHTTHNITSVTCCTNSRIQHSAPAHRPRRDSTHNNATQRHATPPMPMPCIWSTCTSVDDTQSTHGTTAVFAQTIAPHSVCENKHTNA